MTSLLERLYRIARAHAGDVRRPGPGDAAKTDAGAAPETGRVEPPRSGNASGAPVDPLLARYYANLEVPYGADLRTVRRAWRRLLRKYHPDLHAGDADRRRVANQLTAELNRAYRELERALTS